MQGLQAFFWTEEEVNAKLERIMDGAFDGVLAVSQEKEVEMRTAAYIVAIDRVNEATMIRGIYP